MNTTVLLSVLIVCLVAWTVSSIALSQKIKTLLKDLSRLGETLVFKDEQIVKLQSEVETSQSNLQQFCRATKSELAQLLIGEVQKESDEQLQLQLSAFEDELHQRTSEVLVTTIERTTADVVTSATTALVEIPSDDVKGRIIGREGRNIRSFEQITGVDLIIDESPEVVMLSSFDPIRREIARVTLMNLIVDGRIHPAKIEEWYQKATTEVERLLIDSAKKAVTKAKAGPMPRPVLEALGRLRFRTSYSQNVLDHSVEVANIGALISDEFNLDTAQVRRAAMLHDIGKALDDTWDGPHAIAGMNFLKQFTETELVLNAVGAHHRDIVPSSLEAQVVIVADMLSASRPGARKVSHEDYLRRMNALEEIANSHPGVEKSFVMQSGREIRVIVKPDMMSDLEARQLAKEIGTKISANREVAGQIKITVIRESRFIELIK